MSARVAWALVAALALAAAARARSSPRSAAPESTAVILLGTGTPVPLARAQGPATAIQVGKRLFLFDAGPGVMRQIEAAGLPYRNGAITAAFLTHLHSDHTLGLPDLILTSWVMGRRAKLPLYGPPGTRQMVRHLLAAWAEDIDVRTHGLEHGAPGGYDVDVHEIGAGVVYDSAGVRITAIPVPHGSWKWAFGYRIDAPGKSIVISGDTSPCAALAAAAEGVDLLIHEVYVAARLVPEQRPGGEDWVRYMRSFHTSERELAAIAKQAHPGRLVLYHFVRMGASDQELIDGVRAAGYDGALSVGKDLERY